MMREGTATDQDANAHTGEPLAFADFFGKEYVDLVRLLTAMTRDQAEAEDIAQEAMARALERWDRVADLASPGGYVYRVALNEYRARLRRLRIRNLALRKYPVMEVVDPSELLRVEIASALATLTHPQRVAIVLVDWYGLSSEEAAQVLGIAPSSVRARLHRARALLAKGDSQ